jgi:hypothetical protein
MDRQDRCTPKGVSLPKVFHFHLEFIGNVTRDSAYEIGASRGEPVAVVKGRCRPSDPGPLARLSPFRDYVNLRRHGNRLPDSVERNTG